MSAPGPRTADVYTVGLTGGMASGKSTVARMLADEGFLVVDADRLVADLYRPGEPGAALVAELFGRGLLTADGAVDRQAVAERIFGDPEARRRLEEAIHPLVRQRFAALAAADRQRTGGGHPAAVLEATLLVEAGYGPDFDLIVTVEAGRELRLARAVERGMPEEQARARLAAQGDGAERRAAADRVLVNEATVAELREQVAALAREVRAAA